MRVLLGELDLPAVPTSAALARFRVLSALADAPVDRDAVALALTEAVTNAVMHAYRFTDEPGRVRVSATELDHGVEVTVSDDGVGLAPRLDSPGAGLGIPLMTSLTDHIEVDTAVGTRITLRFGYIASAAGGAVAPGRFARRSSTDPAFADLSGTPETA